MKIHCNIRYIIVVIMIIFLSSCLKKKDYRTPEDESLELQQYLENHNIETNPFWNGLYYIEEEAGSGDYPVIYDTIVMDYVASLLDGTVIASSETAQEPLEFVHFNNSLIIGVDLAVSYMKAGTKARVIIPSSLAYGYYQYGDIEPYTTLIYDLEIREIKRGIPVESYNVDTLPLNTTNSGLKYYIVHQDTGELVYKGYTIQVHYTGYLEDGWIFDSSVKRNEPFQFVPGRTELIEGWNEGILLMHVGDKFRFIMPPNLAYGSNGLFPIIPRNQYITFDIEVLKII